MSKVNRRRLLKNVGSSFAAIGAGTLPAYGKTASSDDTIKLPALITPDGPKTYFQVPKSWNQHRKRAKNILNANIKSIAKYEGVNGVGLGGSDKADTYDGHPGLEIRIDVTDDSDKRKRVEKKLPSGIDGIPVRTNMLPAGKLAGNCDSNIDCPTTWDGNYKIEGGGALHGASACCKMRDPDYYSSTPLLLTAAHLFTSNNCPSDVNGKTAYLNGKTVGDVQYSDTNMDYAIIQKTSDTYSKVEFERYIRDEPDYVRGYASEAKIQDWASQCCLYPHGPCVYNRGMTTDRTRGQVRKANYYDAVNSCVDLKDSNGNSHGVQTRCDMAKGDSGSPTYHIDGYGDPWVIGVTALYYDPCENSGCNTTYCGKSGGWDSAGIGAYKIVEQEHPHLELGYSTI